MVASERSAGTPPRSGVTPPLLALSVESLPVAAYVCDAQGRITAYNERAAALWGRHPDPHEPLERHGGSYALMTEGGSPLAHESCWTALVLRDAQPYEGREAVVVRPDGTRRTVLAHASPLFADGELIGAINLLVDTSKREPSNEHLRQRERELYDFFDNGPIGMHCVSADGTIAGANRAALEMLGYTLEECLGVPVANFYGDAEIARRIAAGEPIHNEAARLISKQGAVRHVLLTASVCLANDQELARTHCYILDITEQRAAQAALQASEANFRGFFDSVAVGACQVGNDGRFRLVNDRYCEITGYSRAELLSMSPYDLDHPDDLADDTARVIEFVSNIGAVYRAEKRYIRKDGSIAWVHVAANLLRDDTGQPLHTAAIVEDITERKLAEQALQEADRLKDEFLATLAHELRNPLAPLRSALDLMRAGEQQSAWCRDVIGRQVTHLTRLIDDLLDVSRIASDKLVLDKQRIELGAVLHAAVEASTPMLERCEQTLSIAMPAEPLYLDGDLVRLTQVFTNLLTNAAKFTEGAGMVRLSAVGTNDTVRVSVKDTGVGMTREELSRVFEKFYQAPQSSRRVFGGLGIGLSLVRRLVELHAGTVEAESAGPGLGSELTVTLPLAPAPADRQAPAARAAFATTDSGRRVLIVDDNRDAADALAKLLQVMGHQTTTVYDGAAALERAKLFAADVILLDLGMPGLDGFQTCRRLRELPLARRPRIVALTGWGREQDLARTRETGFDAHLVKPVDSDALESLLAG